MNAEQLQIIRDDFISERIAMIMADNLMTEQEAMVCAKNQWLKYRDHHKLFLKDQPKII